MQHAFRAIPQREGEHAIAADQRLLQPPCVECREQYFGIRMSTESMAATFELDAQIAIVVDLAVEHERVALRGGDHRLMAVGGQIDDRKPAMTEPDAGGSIEPGAAIVGSAMGERARHGLEHALRILGGSEAGGREESGNPAHDQESLRMPRSFAPISREAGLRFISK